MQKLQEKIKNYWQVRANSYSAQHQLELKGKTRLKWQNYLQQKFTKVKQPIKKILDVGTGPGFLAIIAASLGYEVVGIDMTPAMIAEARRNAKNENVQVDFALMDATDLKFKDETFDVVITRNLTWNLENPVKGYQEWLRVLKKGGLLLNFDANWYTYLANKMQREAYEQSRKKSQAQAKIDFYQGLPNSVMEELALQVPLTRKNRPTWDYEKLIQFRVESVSIEENLNSVLWSEDQQINFAFAPLFCIEAIK